jgi:alpha-L-fucosidase
MMIEKNDASPEMVEQGVHNYSSAAGYVPPEQPLLRERLEWFQDQKLALMIHWGPYSQLGLVESWALSDADADWSRTDVDWTTDPGAFKAQNYGLNRSFHPHRVQPGVWADCQADAGV